MGRGHSQREEGTTRGKKRQRKKTPLEGRGSRSEGRGLKGKKTQIRGKKTQSEEEDTARERQRYKERRVQSKRRDYQSNGRGHSQRWVESEAHTWHTGFRQQCVGNATRLVPGVSVRDIDADILLTLPHRVGQAIHGDDL